MSKNKTKFEVFISKSVSVQLWGDIPSNNVLRIMLYSPFQHVQVIDRIHDRKLLSCNDERSKKRKMFMSSMCQHLGFINLELTCHTWDLSGKLSEIIDATASADPFFPISKLVNVVLFRNVTWAKPLSYVIFFEGKINCFRVIFVSLMVLASQGHSPPKIVLLQHISMQCDIQIEKIQTISINTISRVKHIR